MVEREPISDIEIDDIASISVKFHDLGDPACKLASQPNPKFCGYCAKRLLLSPIKTEIEEGQIILREGNRKIHFCRVCARFEFVDVRE